MKQTKRIITLLIEAAFLGGLLLTRYNSDLDVADSILLSVVLLFLFLLVDCKLTLSESMEKRIRKRLTSVYVYGLAVFVTGVCLFSIMSIVYDRQLIVFPAHLAYASMALIAGVCVYRLLRSRSLEA
jgi:heme A synthase